MLTNQKFIAVEADGLHAVEIKTRFIGKNASLLKVLDTGRGMSHPGKHFHKDITGIEVFEKKTTIVSKLSKLELNGPFKTYKLNDSKIVVIYDKQLTPTSPQLKLSWDPAVATGKAAELFFVTFHGEELGWGSHLACFLYLRCKTKKRVHCIKFPNLYNTGKICMGNSNPPMNQSGVSFIETHLKALEHLNTSRYNADLSGSHSDEALSLIRFNVDSLDVTEPCPQWQQYASVVNTTVASNLFEY